MKIDEENSRKFYDMVAKNYHQNRTQKNPHGWFFNEYLEMPAMLNMLGNVKGKKVLDFGCGSGIYANLLTKKGAKISGFDISSEMIKIAKQKNPLLDLRVGSGYNIPFQQKFDIVFASLAIGYMSNWNLVFKQVGKVLNKNGLFVFSTDNPIIACKSRIKVDNKDIIYLGEKDYFQINAKHNSWQMPTGTFQVPWNHKTYEYIIKTIVNSGFELVDYTDAKPLKSAKKYFPEYYEEYSKIPRFSIWKVRKK